MVPGEDQSLARREQALALRLAAILDREAVGVGLASLAHAAAEAGGRLTLLLDLRDAALRGLPWELLEGLAPAEAAVAPCRVVRLADGPGPSIEPARRGGIEVGVGSLDPSDTLCAQVAAATLDKLGLLPGVRSAALVGPPAPAPEGRGLKVLHLVSHGRIVEAQVLVALGGARLLDPGAATRWLDPLAAGLDLVVLDVCSGGAWEGAPGSAPAERLVREGLPAAIAPAIPVDPLASGRFAGALYSPLAQEPLQAPRADGQVTGLEALWIEGEGLVCGGALGHTLSVSLAGQDGSALQQPADRLLQRLRPLIPVP